MKEKYKSVDAFGQSVSLTWRGEESFKTILGATFTWLIFIVLLAYSGYRFFYLVNRFNPTISRTTLIRSTEDDLPFRPQDTGFDFAFALDSYLDKSIGNFTVRYFQQEVINGKRIKNFTEL